MLSDNYTAGQNYKKGSILGTFSSALESQKRAKSRFFQIHEENIFRTWTGPPGTK